MSNEYGQEDAKNMALLFFMDHLMQKSGRRTIHDLSCQFGARGFTEEMRQAVGTTQEGLTEFLSQYPSLFHLTGDQVCINAFGDMTSCEMNTTLMQNIPARNRDYEREAVEFFETKLRKFGPELQIKSLLGHRSQAAPEIRLISGRHLKEFREFLQTQVDHFIVEGDRVRLKNMPEPQIDLNELDDDGKPLAGIRAKQTAVDFLKSAVEERDDDNPIPLDQLYQRFCDRFAHCIRQEVASNPKELLLFLKLNRSIFFIRSNKVSLVKNRAADHSFDCDSDEATSASPSLERTTLVKTLKSAQMAVSAIWTESADEMTVAIDLKTVTLGNGGQEFVTLVVVATVDGRIYLFDLAHTESILFESGLSALLQARQFIKVLHDGRRIGTLLAQRYGINMRTVFDTQLAHNIVQRTKSAKSLDGSDTSFIKLQDIYCPEYMQRNVSESTEYNCWAQRPISDQLLLTIVQQTRCLLRIHSILNKMLPIDSADLLQQTVNTSLVSAKIEGSKVCSKYSRQSLEESPPNGYGSSASWSSVESSPTKCPKCSSYLSTSATVDAATQTLSTGAITALSQYNDK